MGRFAAFLALLLLLSLTIGAWAAGVRYGMSRSEVEEALGKPKSVLKQGSRFVLLYPKGGRVEFEQDIVVSLKNVPVDDGKVVTAPSLAPPPPAAPAKVAEIPDDRLGEAAAKIAGGNPRFDAQHAVEAATERLAKRPTDLGIRIVQPPRTFWGALAMGLLVRTLVTAVVLKIAFKWSDVHADWSQMFIPALADNISQSVIAAAVYAVWKTNQLFFLDTAASYFVLLGVLMKTTHACTLQRAVAVAGAAKLASVVMWTFLSVALLHLFT